MTTINIEQAKVVASDVRDRVVAGRRVDRAHCDVIAPRTAANEMYEEVERCREER